MLLNNCKNFVIKSKNFIVKNSKKVSAWARRNKAELLLASAGATGIATVVTACSATKKMDGIKTEHDIQKKSIVPKDDDESKRQQMELAMKTGLKVFATWSPTLLLGGATGYLGCKSLSVRTNELKSMTRRYINISDLHTKYRQNVVNKFGKETDNALLTSALGGVVTTLTHTVTDPETGKESTVTEQATVLDPNNLPEYSFIFDTNVSSAATKDITYNMTYARATVAMLCDQLRGNMDGVVTVHDILHSFGCKKDPEWKDAGFTYPYSDFVNVDIDKIYVGDPDEPYDYNNYKVLITIKPDFLDVWNAKDPKPVRKELLENDN